MAKKKIIPKADSGFGFPFAWHDLLRKKAKEWPHPLSLETVLQCIIEGQPQYFEREGDKKRGIIHRPNLVPARDNLLRIVQLASIPQTFWNISEDEWHRRLLALALDTGEDKIGTLGEQFKEGTFLQSEVDSIILPNPRISGIRYTNLSYKQREWFFPSACYGNHAAPYIAAYIMTGALYNGCRLELLTNQSFLVKGKRGIWGILSDREIETNTIITKFHGFDFRAYLEGRFESGMAKGCPNAEHVYARARECGDEPAEAAISAFYWTFSNMDCGCSMKVTCPSEYVRIPEDSIC